MAEQCYCAGRQQVVSTVATDMQLPHSLALNFSRFNARSHIADQSSVSRTGTATSSSSSNRYCLCLVLSCPLLADNRLDTGRSPVRDRTQRRLVRQPYAHPPATCRADDRGPFLATKLCKNEEQGFAVLPRTQQVFLLTFWTFALDEGEWSASRSGRFICIASLSQSARPVSPERPCLLRSHSTTKFAEIMAWAFVLTPPQPLHGVVI